MSRGWWQGIVGRVIGRGGETIRALQQASQAHIVVEQNFPEGVPRKVVITGRPDAVERAVKMVTELIQGEPGNAQGIITKVQGLLSGWSVPLLDGLGQLYPYLSHCAEAARAYSNWLPLANWVMRPQIAQ